MDTQNVPNERAASTLAALRLWTALEVLEALAEFEAKGASYVRALALGVSAHRDQGGS